MSHPNAGNPPARTAKRIAIGAGALLALILIVQNTAVVTFRFLVWQMSISQVLLIPLVLALGFAIGMLAYPLLFRRRTKG
ncbi:MAG TPA: LapA family protein [candidate division Zixibacteria bacterium]|nr:LapA family protein [candidate division Zixibacteria bacterium]MDD4916280.1 LapA family protein [candidate division Zixibacteria bacterium]MDM7973661.1 LapA family protein [candidate division Zixibacteria bacterium]HOD67188.1 LapA family protein [candidate division Zixibacteria bacterium]HOZ07176.1 LapA family protein [candidate division Zixibacteria bacterium]